MSADLAIPASRLATFLLVMARIGGVMVFIPMPGLRNGPSVARVLFSATAAFLLLPKWSNTATNFGEPVRFLGGVLAEAALGIGIGLAVSFISETFVIAAQTISLQAGYSYASTIDPNTQAEAGYLVVLAQLLAGLLFFTLGVDRQVLAALGQSFSNVPPGIFVASPSQVHALITAAASIFAVGLRLALPIIALLSMIDIALALIGRLNMQLQVTALTFPVKMLAALGLLAWIAALVPIVFRQSMREVVEVIHRLLH